MGGASPRRRSLRGELGRAGRGVPSSCRCRERAGEAVGEEGAPGFTCRLGFREGDLGRLVPQPVSLSVYASAKGPRS